MFPVEEKTTSKILDWELNLRFGWYDDLIQLGVGYGFPIGGVAWEDVTLVLMWTNHDNYW